MPSGKRSNPKITRYALATAGRNRADHTGRSREIADTVSRVLSVASTTATSDSGAMPPMIMAAASTGIPASTTNVRSGREGEGRRGRLIGLDHPGAGLCGADATES